MVAPPDYSNLPPSEYNSFLAAREEPRERHATFEDTDSVFDTASTLYTHSNGVTFFFVQAKCNSGRKSFKSWELCYASIIQDGTNVLIHLLPVDSSRDRDAPPRTLLFLQGDSLTTGTSKMYALLKVGQCTVSAYARNFPGSKGSGRDELEEWAFAGFGLASSLDAQAKMFAKAVCEAKGWRSLDPKGVEVEL